MLEISEEENGTAAPAEEERPPNLLPALIALSVLLWIFTMTGGRQIFVREMLGSAFDSQAEYLLRGDAGVDVNAIAHEAMIVKGKVRMYFGPFPAFVRMPLNYIYPSGRGTWSRLSGFCAGIIALAAFAALVREGLRSSVLSYRWRNWVGNACLAGFAFGSPLLLLLGNLSIYDEAIVWALAWSMAAIYFLCRSRREQGRRLTLYLLAFSFCAGAALLSRATFGAPFLLIAPLLALHFLRKDRIHYLCALMLPLGAALLFYFLLSYARFGDFSGASLDYHINEPQRKFAAKHGLFSLKRVPYGSLDYFVLRYPEFQRSAPFVTASRHYYKHPTLYSMPFSETYSSLLWCSSWMLFGGVMGMVLLVRNRGARWECAIAAILLLQVLAILSFMGLAQRYVAEFFPFLAFCLFYFLHTGRTALFRARHVIIGLVAVSIVINSLATISWLATVDGNVPAETRAAWKTLFRQIGPR
jgi:hypothetical protein